MELPSDQRHNRFNEPARATTTTPPEPPVWTSPLDVDEALVEAARQGPRIGCGWTFETLDPAHRDPAKRKFVACSQCGRPYLKSAVDSASFKCTKIGCESTSFEPLEVEPPAPLTRLQRRPMPFSGGALRSLADVPLGMNVGAVFFDDTSPQTVICRNNSDRTIHLRTWLLPLWLAGRWSEVHQAAPSRRFRAASGARSTNGRPRYGSIALPPGGQVEAELRVHTFRPAVFSGPIRLYDEHGVLVMAEQDSVLFHAACVLVALLAVCHTVLFAINGFGVALSFGLLVASVYVLTPRLLLVPLDSLLDACFPERMACLYDTAGGWEPSGLQRSLWRIGGAVIIFLSAAVVHWIGSSLVAALFGGVAWFWLSALYGVLVLTVLWCWLKSCGYSLSRYGAAASQRAAAAPPAATVNSENPAS
jgi:hypothetical protein